MIEPTNKTVSITVDELLGMAYDAYSERDHRLMPRQSKISRGQLMTSLDRPRNCGEDVFHDRFSKRDKHLSGLLRELAQGTV